MNLTLPAEFSEDEMLAMLPPNTGNCLASSPAGSALLRARRNGLLHLIAREVWQSTCRGYRGRRRDDVSDFYEETYDEDPLAVANLDYSRERQNVYRLGTRLVVRARGSDVVRLWTLRIGDLIGALKPAAVSEVGCGYGRNLLYLASRFPNIQFNGVELSMSGAKMARQLPTIDLPNTNYGRQYGITQQGMENVRRIAFQQGSAFDLSAEDGSSDMVFTFAALEQMEDGLEKALSEIRRVTRQYALFFEPFLDYNDCLGRAYLWSRNYFRLRTAELRKHGFELVRTWHMLPAKPTFSYAVALCRPI